MVYHLKVLHTQVFILSTDGPIVFSRPSWKQSLGIYFCGPFVLHLVHCEDYHIHLYHERVAFAEDLNLNQQFFVPLLLIILSLISCL